MTSEFMANEVVRELYGLSASDTFNDSFSVVSLESILFGVVATVAWTLERLLDYHKEEVAQTVLSTIVASVEWYHSLALRFQIGDSLVYNESTKGWMYEKEDASKQIVKYAAVRDAGKFIRLLVSGESNGRPVQLNDDNLAPFKEYMNRVKIAGVVLLVDSYPPDQIRVVARCAVDPLVINADGKKLIDGSQPVVDAINYYLSNITYGGTFNKNKLVDAIQNVPGVLDVELIRVSYALDNGQHIDITGNNYISRAGCFVSEDLDSSLTYVVQV